MAAPAAGVLRVQLGSMTATTVSDGIIQRPLAEGFVRNAPLAAVQQALKDAGLPTDQLTVPYAGGGRRGRTARAVRHRQRRIGAPTNGKLLENLGRAGIAPDAITAVVISHCHGDHINGLRNKAGALVFPRARIYVPTPEWAWWMDDQRMTAAPMR
ncbi:MAG: MBL fold metallo-hydrolase [Rubrivivax sp.]|nr:MBL fold metallo-hydrolase [Rubrivivax sp.]